MHLRTSALALALALALAPISARGAPSADASMAAAKALYGARRYPEAARAFEQIYRDTGDTAALFNAGMARAAAGAGHEAHAIYNWRRYLDRAPAVTAEERADLLRRLAAAEPLTAPVELRIDLPGSPVQVELRLAGRDRDPLLVDLAPDQRDITLRLGVGAWTARVHGAAGLLRAQPFTVLHPAGAPVRVQITPPPPALTPVSLHLGPPRALTRGIAVHWEGPADAPPVTTTEADRTWHLTPGAWVLHAEAPGYRPEAHLIHVDRAPSELDLKLRRHPTSTARIALGVTTGAASLGLLAGGLLLFRQGRADFASNVAVNTLLQDQRRQSLGISLAAGGLGLGVVALSEAAGGGRRALLAELGVGSVLAGAGFGLASWHLGRRDQTYSLDNKGVLDQRQRPALAYYALAGAGTGLATASLLAVITHAAIDARLARQTAISASFSPHGPSLLLQRNF